MKLTLAARNTLSESYADYYELVKKAWKVQLSDEDIRDLSISLDNDHVKNFFDTSKKVEADLKVSMQPFTQQLFQSILNPES